MSRSTSTGSRRRSAAPKRGKATTLVPEDARAYRALAAAWLRYDRNCTLVSFERSPWDTKALPDALGLDNSRRLIEVEIKVSKADFLRDAEKPHRKTLLTRIMGKMTTAPQELWYLVPRKILPAVIEGAPEYAGILVPSDSAYSPHSGLPLLEVHRQALRLHSFKLPIPQTFTMAKDMAGTLASVLRDYVRLMGEVVQSPLVVDPTEAHPKDAPQFRQATRKVPDPTPLFVNPPTQAFRLPDIKENTQHDGVRKSWANIGRKSPSDLRPAPGKDRTSG